LDERFKSAIAVLHAGLDEELFRVFEVVKYLKRVKAYFGFQLPNDSLNLWEQVEVLFSQAIFDCPFLHWYYAASKSCSSRRLTPSEGRILK